MFTITVLWVCQVLAFVAGSAEIAVDDCISRDAFQTSTVQNEMDLLFCRKGSDVIVKVKHSNGECRFTLKNMDHGMKLDDKWTKAKLNLKNNMTLSINGNLNQPSGDCEVSPNTIKRVSIENARHLLPNCIKGPAMYQVSKEQDNIFIPWHEEGLQQLALQPLVDTEITVKAGGHQFVICSNDGHVEVRDDSRNCSGGAGTSDIYITIEEVDGTIRVNIKDRLPVTRNITGAKAPVEFSMNPRNGTVIIYQCFSSSECIISQSGQDIPEHCSCAGPCAVVGILVFALVVMCGIGGYCYWTRSVIESSDTMQDSSDGHKRSRPRTDYLSCLICQRSSDETLQRLTEQGYASLLNAVQKRDDEVSLRLQDDVLDKEHFLSMSPLCHAKCRNAYTNKKTVEQRCRAKIRKREQAENLQEPQQHNPQILTRSAGSTIKLKEECFVCRKARDKKGNWTLVLVRTLDRQNSVWSKAKELQDDNMLRELQGFGETCVDMIANDFRYHKTCLDAYMNQTASKTCTKLPNVFEQGLTWLVSQIDDTFSRNKDSVLFLTELRDQYRQWLSEHGVENAMAYRSASLRERIRNYYDSPQGCQIMIFPRKGASSIVCSKDLSIGVLLAEVAKKTQVSVESDDEDGDANLDTEVASIPLSYSYHSAKFLQAEIKENAKAEREHLKSAMSTHVDTGCTTGEQSMEISYAEALRRTGTNLYNHMAWLLTGAGAETNDEGRVELSAKQHEQVLNISQDICSALSSIPTPKHVGTALHVLNSQGSRPPIF